MNARDPRLEWLDGYVRGTLPAADLAALEHALRSDPAFRAQFLDYLDVDLALTVRRVEVEDASVAAPAAFPAWVPRLLVFAAVLALAVGLSFWVGPQPRAMPPDAFLAIVVNQSADARWTGRSAPRGIGHGVSRERIALARGEATLELANGVELQLRAPADFQLHSAAHGTLFGGRLSARVPDEATGFRMDAPNARIVDLGTEFSLVVDEQAPPKVHVFKGRVQASLPAVPESLMELATGESARFDASRRVVARSDEDITLFPKLDQEDTLPPTNGSVRYLRRAPASVESGTFEHDSIVVFRERESAALPEDLIVFRRITHQQAGDPEPSEPERAVLAAGSRVDSYFVHFDRVGSEQREIVGEGTITFERPIVGLVIQLSVLTKTDGWLAHPGTRYETRNIRMLEMRYMGRATQTGLFDEVEIAPDGRTLRLKLRVSSIIDQFRVLVAAKPPE
jgi:ferric-dicitrate binding protein FerR (iron transport regulator)